MSLIADAAKKRARRVLFPRGECFAKSEKTAVIVVPHIGESVANLYGNLVQVQAFVECHLQNWRWC
jgi:hypothetical protein